MDCRRCGRDVIRKRTGPEGTICERCYRSDYHRKKAEVRRAAQLAVLLDVVAAAVPDLDAGLVGQVVVRAAPSELEQKRLLEYLRSTPEALLAGSPHVPRVVGRLAAELVVGGAEGVVRPQCPRCARPVELVHPTADGRVCARCYQAERATECGR